MSNGPSLYPPPSLFTADIRHIGIPEYGCAISPDKRLTNFDVALADGEVVPPLPEGEGAQRVQADQLQLLTMHRRLPMVRPCDQPRDARSQGQHDCRDGQRCAPFPLIPSQTLMDVLKTWSIS